MSVVSPKERAKRQHLKRNIRPLISTVRMCFDSGRILPGLILFYATIDILASLNRPEAKEDVTGQDFTSWVDAYMLSKSRLRCTAVDLYAARCGLVHSYTFESRLSRQGRAREIYYAYGPAKVENMEKALEGWKTPAVAVHVNDLVKAVELGFEKFRRAMSNDPSLAARVYSRVDKFFGPISTEQMSEFLRLSH